MTEIVGDAGRIKFEARWSGPSEAADPGALEFLAQAVQAMERAGCCPVLDDGKSAGNGAALIDGRLFVSESGRVPQTSDASRLVEVIAFDPTLWQCTYRSVHADIRPTSDTPLYWAALRLAQTGAKAALHGHVLDTSEAAELLDVPISERVTLFSTPEDFEAFSSLLAQAPYPGHRLLIRKDHGFFALGDTIGECSALVDKTAARARDAGLLPTV